MRALLAVFVITALPLGAARSQWHVGLELGTVQYRGTSRDTSGSASGAHLRPDHAATYGIRIGTQLGAFAVAVRGLSGKPGIAGSAPNVTLTDKTTGRLLEFVLLVGTQVAAVGRTGVLRAETGPALALWDIAGYLRSRLAGVGAVAYEWPVAGRLAGSVRAEGTVSTSVLESAELPRELEGRATWRYGVTLGLRYRL